MPDARPQVIVVGAGVSGLSCAHDLAAAGMRVDVWTREPPEHTTSTIAAAFWYPYRADPPDRVRAWAMRSYARFAALASQPGTGVAMRDAIEVFPQPIETAPWGEDVPGFRRAHPDELPPGRHGGFCYVAPVIETPVYVPWLANRVRAMGVQIVERTLRDLGPALDAAEIVVHAAGLGARELVGDGEVYAVRGQIVLVPARAGPARPRVVVDEQAPEGLSYVVPRSRDIVLGGTSEERVESTAIDPETSAAILARCRALVPELRDAAPIGARAGLRPCRSRVRVEAEPRERGRLVVHDYGHGGAGVTLSWGCAAEVTRLVIAHVGA
jgi:D-amino-acid oxidase